MTDDFYAVLGVDRLADEREKKARYHHLVKTEHPDKHEHLPKGQKVEKSAAWRAITDAYVVLKDVEARAKYDWERGAALCRWRPRAAAAFQA